MALSDRQRHDAYEAMTAAFAERTDLVIEMLRPAHDLATSSGLESARHDLGRGIESVRRDLTLEIETLRTAVNQEFASFRSEVNQEFASFRSEVNQEFASIRHELVQMEARLTLMTERLVHEAFAAQTRTVMFGLVGAFVLTALTNVLALVLG